MPYQFLLDSIERLFLHLSPPSSLRSTYINPVLRTLPCARVFFFFSFHFLSTSYPSQITGLAHTRRSRMDTPTYLPASTCLYLPACLPAVPPLGA